MKRIGLLGGMSWESSVEYERLLNTGVRAALGGTASADLLIRSYNFAEIEALQRQGDWDGAGALLAADAAVLAGAGCGVIALCTNTMHKVADSIEQAIDVPFVHLVDAAADAARAAGATTVGLLGTRYTMEQAFYRDRLESHGLTVIVPDEADRQVVDAVIFNELVRGVISADSNTAYRQIAQRLVDAGAEAVISGCTEIELLLGPGDVSVPLVPTTRVHVEALLAVALADSGSNEPLTRVAAH